MNVTFNAFGITHMGLRRENNEDSLGIVDHRGFFAIADGMGGHLAGEIAAFHAIRSLCLLAQQKLPLTLEKTCQFFREGITQANQEIFNLSQQQVGYRGMGTTLSCFALTESHVIYGHIGDSRLYRYRKGRLVLLTQDHARKPKSPLGPHVACPTLTKALGTHPLILPDVGVSPLYEQDLYMLCSDGLSDYVQAPLIQTILSSPAPLQQKGEALIRSALEKGGRDNITLLLVQVLSEYDAKNLFRQQCDDSSLQRGNRGAPPGDCLSPGQPLVHPLVGTSSQTAFKFLSGNHRAYSRSKTS